MSIQTDHFKYGKSHKIIHWGYTFDSLTELKYAISIQGSHEFLRSRVLIFFDPGTLKPTNYVRENIRRYTPDFLIRHKETRQAYLVEIKPRAFEGHRQLEWRKTVAENYIKWKGYDWQFKVVYDDEIVLSGPDQQAFDECCKLKSRSAFKLWFEKYNKRFDRSAPTMCSAIPTNRQLHFVMFGQHSFPNNFSRIPPS